MKGGRLFIPNTYLNAGLARKGEAGTIEEKQEDKNNKALQWT